MNSNHAVSVIARLKEFFSEDTDTGLSRALGVSPQTLSSWKSRGVMSYSFCIFLAEKYEMSLDWLLLGRDTEVKAPTATPSLLQRKLQAIVEELPEADIEHLICKANELQRMLEIENKIRHIRMSSNKQNIDA